MADAAREETQAQPLGGRRLELPDGRLEISPAPAAARFALRCRSEHVDQVGGIFAVPLPITPCRAAAVGLRAALWLGPGEWLLLAEDTSRTAIEDAFASASSGCSFSLVDVSHQTVGLILNGSAAAELLSSACPLDLDATVFSPGSCTRTVFGKSQIVVWRPSAQIFRIEVLRSYAEYVWRLLELACADCAPDGGGYGVWGCARS
jgi:sarcosine oxidase, subunit gamma